MLAKEPNTESQPISIEYAKRDVERRIASLGIRGRDEGRPGDLITVIRRSGSFELYTGEFIRLGDDCIVLKNDGDMEQAYIPYEEIYDIKRTILRKAA